MPVFGNGSTVTTKNRKPVPDRFLTRDLARHQSRERDLGGITEPDASRSDVAVRYPARVELRRHVEQRR
jgi:hypothetical protein